MYQASARADCCRMLHCRFTTEFGACTLSRSWSYRSKRTLSTFRISIICAQVEPSRMKSLTLRTASKIRMVPNILSRYWERPVRVAKTAGRPECARIIWRNMRRVQATFASVCAMVVRGNSKAQIGLGISTCGKSNARMWLREDID